MRILTVVGARPQFVKAAAVSLAVRELSRAGVDIEEVLVNTGQHYDHMMSDVFFEELVVPTPAFHLGVGSSSHGQQTADVMARLEPIIVEVAPRAVLVYGDTNSTLGAALVAAKLHVPVVHVEAGLRSFDKRMPEEINRVLTDHVSDLLLCPSRQAITNLASEGLTDGVEFTGDVMYGVLRRTHASLAGNNPVALRLDLGDEPYVAVTMHRASNTDDARRGGAVLDALSALADGGSHVVFPVHPRTRSLVERHGGSSRLHVIEPLGYRYMVALTGGARAVVTDSGGLQKEAAWLGVPCVTVRDETEWVETVTTGWNVLTGADTDGIIKAVRAARAPDVPFDGYGDADAASAAVAALIARYAT